MMRCSMIGIAVVVSIVCTCRTLAFTRIWDGGAGTSSWHDAANWNPDGAPGAGDDVVIDVPKTITVTHYTGITSINSLVCDEHLILSGGTLTIDGETQVNGTLTFSAGEIGGAGDIAITGIMNWSGGTISGVGSLVVSTGTLNISSSATKALNRHLDNHSNISWVGSNQDVDCNAVTITNFAGGTIAATGGLSTVTFRGDDSAINNFGEIRGSQVTFDMDLHNKTGGVVRALPGTGALTVRGGVHEGSFITEANAWLRFVQTNQFSSAVIISGAGKVSIAGDTPPQTIQCSIDVGGEFNPIGLITLNGPVRAGLFKPTGTSVTITGSLDVVDLLIGGTTLIIEPSGSCAVSGTLTMNGGGVLDNRAVMHVDETWTFNLTGSHLKNNGTFQVTANTDHSLQSNLGSSTFTNYGTFIKLGPGTSQFTALSDTFKFNNETEGVVNIEDGTLAIWHGGTNEGIINCTGGNLTTGSLLTNTGTLYIAANRTVRATSGTISNTGAGIIKGTGTLHVTDAVLNNRAEASPGNSPGILRVVGQYNQFENAGADGFLNIEVGGLTAGLQHDQLNIEGTANLAGRLRLSFVNGYVPQHGHSFNVLTADAITGTFGTVTVIGYPTCIAMVVYGPTNVSVVIESIAPTVICQDVTVHLDISGHAVVTAEEIGSQITDNCQVAIADVLPASFDCSDVGSNVVTLSVADVVGNVSACQATVEVIGIGRYIGEAGGSWFTNSNWCGNVVPDADEFVALDTVVFVDQPDANAWLVVVEPGGTLVIGDGSNAASLEVAQTITIQAGGTLELHANATLIATNILFEPGAILNWLGGTITVDGGIWMNLSGASLDIGCMTDDIAVLDVRNFSKIHAEQINVCANGRIIGDATLVGSLSSAGHISPGNPTGTMSVYGSPMTFTGGELEIELAGTGPGAYDMLNCTHEVVLNGLMRVAFRDGFVPALNEQWAVINGSPISGAFNSFEMPSLPESQYLRVLRSPNVVMLRAQKRGDVNADGSVNVADLLSVINQWGVCSTGCEADLSPMPAGDLVIGVPDLLMVINNWG